MAPMSEPAPQHNGLRNQKILETLSNRQHPIGEEPKRALQPFTRKPIVGHCLGRHLSPSFREPICWLAVFLLTKPFGIKIFLLCYGSVHPFSGHCAQLVLSSQAQITMLLALAPFFAPNHSSGT